ncbi:DUF4184 family protein [Streptomyces sp. PTM05]|uniref:DUF4184 family protein n=1 Tax=Streptantibioticus parmotrematis TaxID=2873249 RepID=A0ABS7QXJ1_9ACTN|nr:DUF4184 family protein [Streptantibioticus parmotrematis]MBY8887389.1 DUF4184 family protein [Streptantibioticus parmotrematis]
MPFTFSHPAAVLPALRAAGDGSVRGRGPLLVAGLVAGSLAPDVPFFLDSVLPGTYGFGRITHRPAGVPTLDPLIAAALAGGWTVARGPLTELLPPGTRLLPAARPLPHTGREPVADAARFWLSATVGAATHVGWDAFTHGGRWGVRRFPVLRREVAGVPLHHWAQYGSSAAGLVTLAVWSRRAVRDAPRPTEVADSGERSYPGTVARRVAVTGVAGCAVAGAVLRCVRDRPRGLSSLIASATFGAGAATAVAAGAYAGGVRTWRAVRGR